MSLVIYNSRTRRKEEFVPLTPGRVTMYVCGVTVYDDPHIGHARCYVAFDAIVRHFLSKGWQVEYVRNFTDVDDKIIARARERGEPWDRLARRFEGSFREDMAALGVLPPTVEPRATEHIAEIIATVETLLAKGHAYEARGDVYFAVDSFGGYGALSGRNLDEMRAGARVEVDRRKRHPLDFALWKASKPGEPSWDSPWGPGRPGWHIECSVMSQKYLGAQFDIHGGGRDLIFPHHENEVAQAEAAGGNGFARFWVHNGFVQVDQEKMSKSLGNFYTIKDILKEVDPEALRLFLLSAHYRSPLDFSDQALGDAAAGLARLYTALRDAGQAMASGPAEAALRQADDRQGRAEIEQAVETFEQAMDDDFNTAGAIGALFALARIANRLFAREPSPGRDALLGLAAARLRNLGARLGLLAREPMAYLQGGQQAGQQEAAAEIEALIAQRSEAREQKDFARADAIREQLSSMGVVLEDTAEGTRWRRER